MSEPETDAGRAGLRQDPHAARPKERRLEVAIGRAVRAARRERGLTVAQLATQTGLSAGMLSKIENGAISPSLATLQALVDGLSMPITTLFRDYDTPREAVHVRAGEGVELERRGSRAGHQYRLLGHLGTNASGVTVEPYLITLTDDSDIFPTFQHGGLEFIHMLEGQVGYRHGERVYPLAPGDSLFFDAEAPHGPEVLTELPARYLSIIAYPQDN